MQRPIAITARSFELPPPLELQLRQRAENLERFYPNLLGCSVHIEGPGRHHQSGGPVSVAIELRVPGNEPVIVSRQAGDNVGGAANEAFDAATRELQDLVRRRRGLTKTHEPAATGKVMRLVADPGYGFLETADGREIYFHRNAVLDGGFDRLEVGDEVTFHEEPGDEGPQASTLRPTR